MSISFFHFVSQYFHLFPVLHYSTRLLPSPLLSSLSPILLPFYRSLPLPPHLQARSQVSSNSLKVIRRPRVLKPSQETLEPLPKYLFKFRRLWCHSAPYWLVNFYLRQRKDETRKVFKAQAGKGRTPAAGCSLILPQFSQEQLFFFNVIFSASLYSWN